MKKALKKSQFNSAFTFAEIIITVAVLAIFAGAALIMVSGAARSAKRVKLDQNVTAINSAIATYLANGGSLEGADTAVEVIERVKSRATDEQADEVVGIRSGLLDPRLVAVAQDEAEGAGSSARALWDVTKKRFVIRYAGAAGIKEFALDESKANDDPEYEREQAVKYAKKGASKWIWEFGSFTTAANDGPTSLAAAGSAEAPLGLAVDRAPLPLLSPTVSLPGDTYALSDYPGLVVTLNDPNPAGVSEIFYSTTAGVWERYTGAIPISPGTKLDTQAASIDPDHWSDSLVAVNEYLTNPVKLDLAVEFNNPDYNYVTLGGTVEPGSYPPPTLVAPGMASLLNSSAIPAEFLNSGVFEIRWTLDGTDPRDPSAEVGDPFSGGFPGQEIPVWLNLWGPGDTLPVAAYAKSINPAITADSDLVNRTLQATRLQLRTPLIEITPNPAGVVPPIFDVTISRQVDFGDTPLGTRIFYTTDGSDPGVGGDGEPLGGILYTAPFQVPPTTIVSARVYPPALYQQWFLPSEPGIEASSDATFFDLLLEDKVLIVLDASGSMNMNFSNSNRFSRVIQEVIDAVDALPASYQFDVVTFNSGIHWNTGSTDLRLATAANKQSVRDALVGLHAQGGTNYAVGLNRALSLPTRPKQVIFLSDGLPNQRNYLAQTLALAALGTRIDTIGIGHFQSQERLQEMATLTGGSYRFVSEPGSAGVLNDPRFSVNSNSFNYDQFPIQLALTNPNSEPTSLIRFSINGGAFQIYSAPFSVGYNATVEAYVDSTDHAWRPSSTVSASYFVKDFEAARPTINLSADRFTDTVPQITVTLTDVNPPGLANLVYWFSTQTEAEATPYAGAFTLAAADWNSFAGETLKEVKVYARAISAQPFVVADTPQNRRIQNQTSAFFANLNKEPLDTPEMSPGGDSFDYTDFPFNVAVSNPDGIGVLEVAVNGGAFAAYSGPISVTWGTTIKAQVKAAGPGTNGYRNSAVTEAVYSAKPTSLELPSIQVSSQYFTPDNNSITVTLTNRNPAAISGLVYWFDGKNEALATPYTGPFTLSAADWETYIRNGKSVAKLFAKAVGTESFAIQSKAASVLLRNFN